MRSRVMPGSPSTMAIRWPTMRLNKADFPTLGRPTIATTAVAMTYTLAYNFRRKRSYTAGQHRSFLDAFPVSFPTGSISVSRGRKKPRRVDEPDQVRVGKPGPVDDQWPSQRDP